MTDREKFAARIPAFDHEAASAARAELDRKTKPRRSLGVLEDLAVQLAGIRGRAEPPVAAIVVAAADHGYAEEDVSPYPREVTRQMVRAFAGGGAAVSVLARAAGARLVVVDSGVLEPVDDPSVRDCRGGAGTRNATRGPAMDRPVAEELILSGIALATELAAERVTAVALGEMGIGNTTAASALHAALLRVSPDSVCGPGAGLDEEGVRRKVGVVERALAANAPLPQDPVGTLAALGGFEIAFLTGVALGAAAAQCVVVIDGFISGAAALVASQIAPGIVPFLVAAHLSPEPGHELALAHLGLRPLLDLELRLGEGSGAALALPLLHAAAAIHLEMATFASAGVSDAGR